MSVDPVMITTALGWLAKKVLDTLYAKVPEAVWKKLQGDPAQKAFAQALGAAITRYSSSPMRPELARALSDRNGPLQEVEITTELAKLLRFDLKPDASLIGQRWKAAPHRSTDVA